ILQLTRPALGEPSTWRPTSQWRTTGASGRESLIYTFPFFQLVVSTSRNQSFLILFVCCIVVSTCTKRHSCG
ncbi:hypothetical protein FOC4_g10009231, partial [Fusarium odoratissimum]